MNINDVQLMIRPGHGTQRLLLPLDEQEGLRGTRVSATFVIQITGDELGERVRDLRERRGLSQSELAFLCGTTNKTISSIENNTQKRADSCALLVLLRITEACQCSLSALLAREWKP